ncbi:MAG: hypothetical protein EAZ08_02345 [Cytophagales bacterium]|nr:MAG: hypothetical protein EAZ08_02345 [Cytophagales bacterium]
MRTSKNSLIAVLSFVFVSFTFFNAFADDNPKKDSLKKETSKQVASTSYSQDETKFITEMDAYFAQKYSNPLNLVQSKVEKVIVVDLGGKVIQELNVTDHKEHEAILPVGAEKLTIKGNTAYYLLLK